MLHPLPALDFDFRYALEGIPKILSGLPQVSGITVTHRGAAR